MLSFLSYTSYSLDGHDHLKNLLTINQKFKTDYDKHIALSGLPTKFSHKYTEEIYNTS